MAARRFVVSALDASAMGPSAAWIDASFHLPGAGRNARQEFTDGPRIPGAVFWDLDTIKAPSDLPHMVPSAEAMAMACARARIQDGGRDVVVYDSVGLFSSPRLWWQLRAFGHQSVFVLDGGLGAWVQAGLPVEHGPDGAAYADAGPQGETAVTAAPGWMAPRPRAGAVASMRDVEALARSAAAAGERGTTGEGSLLPAAAQGPSPRPVWVGAARPSAGRDPVIIDARPAARFQGSAKEPRPQLVPGHIPGSASVPASDLAPGGTLLPPAELSRVFRGAGVNPHTDRRIITTCGSGVTAAVVSLALAELGRDDALDGLFDGAWTEYGDPARR